MKSIAVRALLITSSLMFTLGVGKSAFAQANQVGEDESGDLGAPETERSTRLSETSAVMDHPANMDNALSLMGILSYFYTGGGFGFGVRYQKTLIPNGFLHHAKIKDDFGIEGSFEYRHYGSIGAFSYNQFELLAGAVWNVWFTPRFAAYPKLGFGASFGSFSDGVGVRPTGYGGFVVFGAAGVLYKLTDQWTLRGEVGSDSVQIGAAYKLF